MPATQFAVVYGTVSKRVRRIVENDADDAHIAQATANLRPGESIIVLNIADFPVRNVAGLSPSLRSQLNAASITPQRAVGVVGGMVTHSVVADPSIDTMPNGTLILSDGAAVGDLWNGSFFHRRLVLVDSTGGLQRPAANQFGALSKPVFFTHPSVP